MRGHSSDQSIVLGEANGEKRHQPSSESSASQLLAKSSDSSSPHLTATVSIHVRNGGSDLLSFHARLATHQAAAALEDTGSPGP